MKFSLAFLLATVASAFTTSTAFQPARAGVRVRGSSHLRASSAEPPSMKKYLETLIDGKDLGSSDTEAIFGQILQDNFDPLQVSALLMLLRQKGETKSEVAGMVRAMNNGCNRVNIDKKMLDIVGTGGDGADTINISTASVVLCAAAGCIVAKAGNRSVSSKCGSADVLEQLGVKVDLKPTEVEKCVEDTGIAFMFAPINHPSMRFVAPVRKSLGIRSCFNILGPMTNAAGAQHAVIGVFDDGLAPLMADTLMEVGRVDHAVVIHGCGLDEISPIGPSQIVEIKNTAATGEPKKYEKKTYMFDPLDIGIPRCGVLDLKGGEPEENMLEFRKVLEGGDHTNAKRDSVVLNAGVGCYVYGLADSIEEGVKLARKTLEAGKATTTLENWIKASNGVIGA